MAYPMKGITYCGACSGYDKKKHRCTAGACEENDPRNPFYDDCPLPDVAPIVHGRWIATLVPDGYVQKSSRLRKQCSVCGWTNACRYKYCPNCGAKMDGDGYGI